MSEIYDVFKIGIGPSSSHTVGPMRAARAFARLCQPLLDKIHRVQVDLYGSLALTGVGHATDRAVILGLMYERPDTVDINQIDNYLSEVRQTKTLHFAAQKKLGFEESRDLLFHFREALPEHANGMLCQAFDGQGKVLLSERYFSIGGGLIKDSQTINFDETGLDPVVNTQARLSFSSAQEMLELCQQRECSIAELMWQNEYRLNRQDQVTEHLKTIWQTMQSCVTTGLTATSPVLPGGLNVQRRAPALYQKLKAMKQETHSSMLDWVSAFALAVNEENAAGHRVVTAPTNGSAGVIPATLHYLQRYYPKRFTEQAALDFLMSSGAIGLLYQKGASISAAEMGCQGEIGVSASMAAAGLCEFLGGDIYQVTNAAEIAMEHHLGMTCDPVKGLVQIPCIERNSMGAIKAISAAQLALARSSQKVSLDQVIRTMYQTGKDMSSHYKETALAGLAVNVADDSQSSNFAHTEAIQTVPYRISQNQTAC